MEEGAILTMVSKGDYDALQVEAARSVVLELARLLGEYRDDTVVVGGWVPALLIPQKASPHVGSLDVDLALNHRHDLGDDALRGDITPANNRKRLLDGMKVVLGSGDR